LNTIHVQLCLFRSVCFLKWPCLPKYIPVDRVGGVMVGMIVVYHRFKLLSIGICCFSTKRAALISEIKDWLVRNQDGGVWFQ
jgi:hypothetical protein